MTTTQPTINNTNTVQKLKEMGCLIHCRNNNHHVQFSLRGDLFEITAKNNRDYQLNKLSTTNEGYKKEIAFNINPSILINNL